MNKAKKLIIKIIRMKIKSRENTVEIKKKNLIKNKINKN